MRQWRHVPLALKPRRWVVVFLILFFLLQVVDSFKWPRRLLPSVVTRTTTNDNDNHNPHHHPNDQSSPLSSLQLEPLLQVPCSLQLVPNTGDSGMPRPQYPLGCFLDTGAQRTCMTYASVKRLGLAHLMDTRYKGQATGVGGLRTNVLGRIPAQTVLLQFASSMDGSLTIMAPAITVLQQGNDDTDEVELLLGLDFLRETRAILNLHEEFLQLSSALEITSDGASTRPRKDSTPKTIRISFIRPRSSIVCMDSNNNQQSDYAKAKEFVITQVPRYLERSLQYYQRKGGENNGNEDADDEDDDSDLEMVVDERMDMRGL